VLSSMLHDPVIELYEVLGARSIRDPASELPRTHLPGTSVNKARKRAEAMTPWPYDALAL
jgi:hypothetical protein